MPRHAHYSLGDYSAAASAFKRGLDLDPSNASLKTGLQNSEARLEVTSTPTTPPSDTARGAGGGPDMGGLADMLGGMGGGGGGMPDVASLMQNPMLMQMAQQMMANGGLERMMQNPTVANMVSE